VHPDPQCFETAVRRQAFRRALRLAAAPEVEGVRAHLAARAEQQLDV
jgi:hypothetical protein